jgi:hypothetical protein
MGEYDDDNQRAAYERARDFAAFADIAQHFGDTGSADHDNIDYDTPDFDGAEYDDNGEPVLLIDLTDFIAANPGATIILAVCDAIDQFGGFADIPDDYDFGLPDNFYEGINYDDGSCYHEPSQHRLNRAPDGPFCGPYKPLRGFYGTDGYRYDPDTPDID